MAQIVFAGACSHGGLIVRAADRIDQSQRDRIYRAYAQLSRAFVAARPQAVVIFGADHFNAFQLSNMPAFCIGSGKGARTFGDAGVPGYDLTYHEGLSRWLVRELMNAEFDVATAYNLRVDHGFACPLHLIMPQMDVPVVPIFINCAAAPLPRLSRTYQLGLEVRRAIAAFKGLERVAVLGSGGLSHWVPIPDIENPKDDLDRRIIELMRSGDSVELEKMIVKRVDAWAAGNKGNVAEDFDREIIDAMSAGHPDQLLTLTDEVIARRAGNGGQEIRTWLAAAAATGAATGSALAYEPVPSWLTGVGVFEWSQAGVMA